MSDNEVEEVSFLPGASAKNKRAVYEPSGPQRCKQLVCSKEIAITVGVVVCAVILAVAFIAAFARPEKGKCNLQEKLLLTTTTLTVEPHPKYITKNGKKFPWENVRLPTSVIPLHYDIFLHPNLTMSVTKGRVTITCRVVKDTNFVVFHIKQLNVTEFSVQSKTTGKNVMAKDYLLYEPNDQMYIELERKLSQGEEFDLLVYFEGALIEQLSGFYKSSYQTKAGETRYIASTMFESTDARKGFPCFDEPLLKANFSLSMVREPDYISLFNMPLSSSKLYREGLMLDKFQTSFKMSTYLVAFVVCDFANITQRVSNRIMVRAFAPRDLIQDVEFALKTAVHILEYYETFFGVRYPLPKQDMIAIPDFAAGAMENWGLIAYNTKAILYNSEISSVNDKIWVAVVVAHELAHQWFGNLVTMEWWDDLWLNEGFATFVENIGVNQILSDSHMDDQFVLKSLHKSLLMDSLSNSHPIHFNIIDPNMIQEAFDDISYDKGAAILRMLQHFMGENFRKGLISYLKKYEFANANTDDLWNSLSQSFTGKGVDIKAVMDTWIKQKGYPLVTLKSQGDTIVASQTRFLLSPKSKEITGQQPSPFKYNWYIPFTYITSKNTSLVNTVWMNMTSVTFSVPADITWIKGNSHAYGFYRVNYEESNWKKLISQLTTNHLVFSVSDRAALIDDMFNLGRAGKVKYSFVLDMTEYLVNEEEYVPLASALSQFYNIFFLLDGRPARRSRLFEKYLLKLIVPKIQKLGWTDDEGPLLQRFLRNEVLCAGVLIGHTETVNKGVALFQEWMLQNKSISPNLKNVVYLAGIMYGNEKSWQFCWKKYQDAIDPSEKEKLLQALSHTSNSELKYRLLEYSLDRDKVRPQDSHLAITSGARSRTGRILAWDFLKRNWEKIFKRYGEKSFIFQNLLKGVPSHFSSEFDYNEVKEFFRDRNVGSGKIALQQTLENIQSNIEWLKTYEKEVSQWLAKHGQ